MITLTPSPLPKSPPNLSTATLDDKPPSITSPASKRSYSLPTAKEKQKILPALTKVGKTVLKGILYIGYAIFKLFSCLIPCIGKSSSKANLAALSEENERLAQENSELRAQLERLAANKENQPLQDKRAALAADPRTQQDQDKVAVLENAIEALTVENEALTVENEALTVENEALTVENKANKQDWEDLDQLVNSSSKIFKTNSSSFDDSGIDSDDLVWDDSVLQPQLNRFK